MPSLDEVIKSLNKNFKTDIITKDNNASTLGNRERVPFRSPSLQYLFFGGLPVHTLWEISGQYSSGKTVLTMDIAGQFQKYYKDKWEKEVEELQAVSNPNKTQKERLNKLLENGYKKVVWLDSEHSLDSTWAAKNNLDVDDIIYIKPQEESAEELLDACLALIASDGVCLLVIDSVAALTSGAALNKSLTEKTYCGIAGPLTTFTSKLLPIMNKFDCTVICINQQRDTLDAMFKQTHTPGGQAFKYGTSCRLELRKGKSLDDNCNEIPNKEGYHAGQIIEVQVLKNKLSNPSRRITRLTLMYETGLNPVVDTINLAITLGLIKKAGAWFSIIDDNGEAKVHENGDTMKWQGLANVIKYMQSHEDVYKEVYEAVNEVICRE